MTLAPDAAELVEQLGRNPAPHEQPIEQARAMLDAGDVLAGPKEPVAQVDDRSVPGPEGPIPIRVYRPSPRSRLGIAMFFHGGGFSIGGLASHDRLCRALANRSGCVVVAVDYRLSPEHPFPAGIEDSFAATEWVSANAATIGGDRHRLAVGGDSGGGTFGAAVALMARERGGPPIRFQYLLNPGGLDYDYSRPSCLDNGEGCFLTVDAIRWVEEQYFAGGAERSDPRAALNLAPDLSGLPPAIVLTAEHDPARDQGAEYVRRLRAAGVPVRHTDYPGMIHGWVNFKGAIADGERGLDELAAAIRAALAD
ncbi:MAG TPA: alpha/beta hydrolase [Acidimicrobiia bacterium]